MPDPGKDILYKVAYEEAVRALSEQQAVIDSFRNRAGLLLSAAAVTTSFLGAQALGSGDPSLFSWLALAGFFGVAAASLAILWPRGWEFAANSHDVIASYIECSEAGLVEGLHQELSLHMQWSYLTNHQGLAKLVVFLQLANVLLVIEVALWIIAIAMTS
jgi:hypothetical protein